MPRRHSSMGVHKPTHNMTITNARVNRTNLHQNEALQQEFQDFIEKYVITQYVDSYNINDTTLQAYDTQYGQFIQDKLNLFKGYNLNSEQRRDNTWFQNNASAYSNLVNTARQGFVIQAANTQQHTKLQELQATIDDLNNQLSDPARPKNMQTALLAEVNSNVSLDMRYWYYIKHHGPPENGIFDPEKLAQLVFTDAQGNILPNQDAVQYPTDSGVATNQGPDWSNGDMDPLLMDENTTASNIDFDAGFNDDGNDNFWQ